MEDMSKSNSKEDSTWRRRLPRRSFAMLPNAHPEPRPFVNKYFFRRPRLLQYYDGGVFVDSHGRRLGPSEPRRHSSSQTPPPSSEVIPRRTPSVQTQAAPHLVEESTDPETSKVQRDWLNLFIDLLWVGIVSNISSCFVTKAFDPAQQLGLRVPRVHRAVPDRVPLLELHPEVPQQLLPEGFPADGLPDVGAGAGAVFREPDALFLGPAGGKWIIGTFLTAKGSFVAMEVFYSYFIPSIRREVLIDFPYKLSRLGVLWGSAVAVAWPAQAALILPAVILEGIVSAIFALPLGDWFLRGAPKKALDPDNFVDRLQGFFIIVLGEGVYGLIGGNDWGVGLSARVVFAIEALIIYYSLFWLFFTGDQTKTYIHAIYRNRYTSLAFHL